IVLDKTGTLTLGNPEVTAVHPCADATAESVVRAAAVAEARSEHPLAKAVLRKAADMSVPVTEPERFEYVPGRGIARSLNGERIVVGSRAFPGERQVDLSASVADAGSASEMLVGSNGRLLGSLNIEDTLRPEAVQAVAALRRMGLRSVLLTGAT